MGCGSCSSGGGCGSKSLGTVPAGCNNNGTCMTSGCNKLDVYDWLVDMDLPSNYKPFDIVEVRFKCSRKEFFVNSDNLYLEMGEMVVVEPNTGGYDIGHVSLTGELVRLQLKKHRIKAEDVSKKVYRKASENDVAKYNLAKGLEWETMHRARNLALELGLSMKISDVDYQGDKTKATFYYTAEGRVDFRELIKKMAEAFRIRIEMRQIGMRQEASRLGGIGSCGRELCCSTWLTEFKTVSTSAARYQNLSLNTLKLAGQCGKLKCCLNYELDSYLDALKDIPNNIDRIETESGTAYLQKTDIFKKTMWFSYPKAENWIPIPADQVREIAALNAQGKKAKDLVSPEKEETPENADPDYENVVGQDSLTRLDDRNRKKKKRKPKRNRGEGATAQSQSGPRNQQVRSDKTEDKAASGNKPKRTADSKNQEGQTGRNPRRRPTGRNRRGPRGKDENGKADS